MYGEAQHLEAPLAQRLQDIAKRQQWRKKAWMADLDDLLQAKLAAGDPRGQKGQLGAPAASCGEAAGHELRGDAGPRRTGAAPAVSPLASEPSWHGTPAAVAPERPGADIQPGPVSQQVAQTRSEERAISGNTESGSSSGNRAPSEGSLPSIQGQASFGGAEESPIRGLILPEHPADSRVAAENLERILRGESPVGSADGRCWNFSGGAGSSPASLSDGFSRLQSQPLVDTHDSASSRGWSGVADAAVGALTASKAEPIAVQVSEATGWDAVLPAVTGSSCAWLHDGCDNVQAEQGYGFNQDGAASCSPDDDDDGHEAEHPAGRVSPGHSAEGRSSCSPASGSLCNISEPLSEPAAALRPATVVQRGSAAQLLSTLCTSGVQRFLLGGGVMLVALVAAMRRRSGILQLLRTLIRAFAIYGETIRRLQ